MDDMDKLLFSAAKEQTQMLPTHPVWEALCRRREREKRLRRIALRLAAGAALLTLGFLAGRLNPLPVSGPGTAVPPTDETPGIITVVPPTDGTLLSVDLGEFLLPNLIGIDSLLEMDFKWLPADWIMEADEAGTSVLLYDESGVAAVVLTLYHESYGGLLPGMGRCLLQVERESGYLDSVTWVLRLKEDVWVKVSCDQRSVRETLDFVQGIVKRMED